LTQRRADGVRIGAGQLADLHNRSGLGGEQQNPCLQPRLGTVGSADDDLKQPLAILAV
jgi:hypothetical protein